MDISSLFSWFIEISKYDEWNIKLNKNNKKLLFLGTRIKILCILYFINLSFPLNTFSWNEIKITPVILQLEQNTQWDGSRVSLSTLFLFSEQRLGFSMLPLRLGLWLWCIQRLTIIKVQFPWVLDWAILVNLVEVSAKVVVLVLRPVWRTGSCSFCRDEEARYLKWPHWKASWVFSFSAVLCLFQLT